MKKTLVLVALALLGGAWASGPANADTAYPHLDPAKVARIVQLTSLLDKLPQKTYPITIDNAQATIAEWQSEIMPMYAHLGIVNTVTPPVEINFFNVPYGNAVDVDGYTFHLLGMSYCSTPAGLTQDGTLVVGPIYLNVRYVNPVSPWYQDASFLPTLTHELGHSLGICSGPSDYIESSTQVATIEVLAGMANAGLDGAFLGLLDEYRAIAYGAVEYEALAAGHLEEFEQLYAATAGRDARKASMHAASVRNWRGSKRDLKDLLFKYEYVPYIKIQYGLDHGSIAASNTRGRITAAHVLVPSGKPLSFAELDYFLAHAEERIAALTG